MNLTKNHKNWQCSCFVVYFFLVFLIVENGLLEILVKSKIFAKIQNPAVWMPNKFMVNMAAYNELGGTLNGSSWQWPTFKTVYLFS